MSVCVVTRAPKKLRCGKHDMSDEMAQVRMYISLAIYVYVCI